MFIPNDSKNTYNYDAIEPSKMISLAKLDNIALTQSDRNEVIKARQRLAKVTYSNPGEKSKKTDFTFIVNDNRVYTSLKDFRKAEARKLFQEMREKQKDLDVLEKELENLREKYSKANNGVRKSMSPGILDKEKRVDELRTEIGKTEKEIRNIELE